MIKWVSPGYHGVEVGKRQFDLANDPAIRQAILDHFGAHGKI
jgi:hypothetical protein